MAVSKQVADAYKNHFGTDIIGDTVETPVLPSGSAEAIISPSKIGAEAVQSTKKVPPVEMPTLPTFGSVAKKAFSPQGSTEYVPSQGVGYDYTKESKLLTDTQLQDAIRKQDIKDSGAYSPSPSEPMKALNTELSSRNAEKQRIFDQNDMLQRKLNFQARQKELGVTALDEAASTVGTDKFTDMTGVDYFNPWFYLAKAADLQVTAGKAVAQGALGAVSSLGASIDLNAGDNIVGDFGEAVADYAKIIKQKYPQLNPAKNIGGWTDPEFYVKGVSEMVPNLVGGMTAAAVGAAIGGAATVNPVGAVAGGIAGATSFGYAMESGSIYDDLLTRGYSPSSAEYGSKAYGAIAALPEAFFHIRGVGSALVHPMMQEALKKGAQAELKQTLFTGAKELAKKGIKKTGGAVVEGTTEAMQQIAQNSITRFYDKNQAIFDGVAESFVFGAGSGGLVESFQNMGNKDVNKEAVIAVQNEKALEKTVAAAEQLQKNYPKDKDIAGVVLKAKTELKNAQIQTKIVDAKFVQENTTPIVQNEVLDATVSKNIDGKFIATFDTNLDGQSVTFVSKQLHTSELEAQIEVAQTTQDWLTKQVDSGTVQNIEQATQLNESLKEIISPKVETTVDETTQSTPSIVDQFKKYSVGRIAKDKNNKFNPGLNTKAFGMQDAAVIRKLEGKPTKIEVDNAIKYLKSNYKGKEVNIGNLKGTVVGTAFGKIRVQMQNGEIKSFSTDKISPAIVSQGDAINHLRNEATSFVNKTLGIVPSENNVPATKKTVEVKPTIESKIKEKESNTKKTEQAQSENNVKKEGKVIKEDKQFVSKVSQRMSEEFGTEKILADKININEESKKAVDLVLKDKDKAYRVAMGIDDVSTTEQTFVNNALYMRAVEEGNFDLANKLIKKGSMVVTDAAQTLNAAKASVSDNSARKYLQELMLTRFLMANDKYTADIQDKQEKTTPTQRVKKMVKKDVDSIKNYIKEKKVFDIKQAQDFISSLQCK